MGWFTPKCPQCSGPLVSTGYSAPYPSYRCDRCIAEAERDIEIKRLSAEVEKLSQTERKAG